MGKKYGSKGGILYLVTSNVSGKRYIGITSKTLKQRWAAHVLASRHSRKNCAFGAAIRKYGKDEFTMRVLRRVNSWNELLKLEVKYIKRFNTKAPNGYNLTDGGEGNVGYKVSEISREKIRQSSIGRKYEPRSPDFRRRLSLAIQTYHLKHGRKYTYNGKRKTITAWAAEPVCKVNESVLRERICRWKWSISKALTTACGDFKPHLITCNGETLTAAKWSKRSGVRSGLIVARITNYGWKPEDAIFRPNSFTAATTYQYQGKLMTIKEITLLTRIPEQTLRGRLKCGYDMQSAIEMGVGRKRYTYQGKTFTAAEWARKQNINPSLLYGRLGKNGGDIVHAIEMPRHNLGGSKVKYRGQETTIWKLSQQCKLPVALLNNRILVRHWTVSRAISTPKLRDKNNKWLKK